MLGMFKKKFSELKSGMKKVENRDLMEAVVAASILVAYADGDCSDEELGKLSDIVNANEDLSLFGSEIDKTIDAYSKKMEVSARMGKINLMKEIADVKFSDEEKVQAFVIAIEVADADGDIDDKELDILRTIGAKLGLNAEDYI